MSGIIDRLNPVDMDPVGSYTSASSQAHHIVRGDSRKLCNPPQFIGLG